MQTDPVAQSDHETEFVACLLEAAHKTGLCFSEAAFVNFYVALKSKPMVILTGPEGSGKIKAVRCLSRILMGDCARCQLMVGPRPAVKDNGCPMANHWNPGPCFSNQKCPTLGG
jgi:hypothetical protein